MSRKINRKTQQKVKKLNIWSKISRIAGFVLSFAGLFASTILFATSTSIPAIASLVGSLLLAFGGIVGSVVLEEKAKSVAESEFSNDNYKVEAFENNKTKTNTVQKEQPKEFVEQKQIQKKDISKEL